MPLSRPSTVPGRALLQEALNRLIESRQTVAQQKVRVMAGALLALAREVFPPTDPGRWLASLWEEATGGSRAHLKSDAAWADVSAVIGNCLRGGWRGRELLERLLRGAGPFATLQVRVRLACEAGRAEPVRLFIDCVVAAWVRERLSYVNKIRLFATAWFRTPAAAGGVKGGGAALALRALANSAPPPPLPSSRAARAAARGQPARGAAPPLSPTPPTPPAPPLPATPSSVPAAEPFLQPVALRVLPDLHALQMAAAAFGSAPPVRDVVMVRDLKGVRLAQPACPGLRVATLERDGLLHAGIVTHVNRAGQSVSVLYDVDVATAGAAASACKPTPTVVLDVPLYFETELSERVLVPLRPDSMVEVWKEGDWSVAAVASTNGLTSTLKIAAPDGNTSTLEVNVLKDYVLNLCSRSPCDDDYVSVYENVVMKHEWRRRINLHLTGEFKLACSSVNALDDGGLARRLRLIWASLPLATVPDGQYDALRSVLGVETLDVTKLFKRELGDKRSFLNCVTTSRAATGPQLAKLNLRVHDALARRVQLQASDLKMLGDHNLAWDEELQAYRNLTLREVESLLSLPARYVSDIPTISYSDAMRMLGDGFELRSIFKVLLGQLPRLQRFERINVVSLFDGIGGGPVVAIAMHLLGLVRLNAIISVELDAARQAVFKRFFDCVRPAPCRLAHAASRSRLRPSARRWWRLDCCRE